ncbi:hypothetical protein V6N13_131683 [Hibiscus sabdariffa]|uniref:Uncharacterized protein n=1 Tax=Hibiscus sabdariffa TaxID=183260 RepID=A0ABR2D8L2_9ROSI
MAQPKSVATTPPKSISRPKPPVATTVPKSISEPKPPVATVKKLIVEPKPPMATTPQFAKEKTGGKEVETLSPSKQQEEIQRNVSPIAKQIGEKKDGGSMPTKSEIVEKKNKTTYGLKVFSQRKG